MQLPSILRGESLTRLLQGAAQQRLAGGHLVGCSCGLAYVYFEDEPGRQTVAKLLTRDEAHRGNVEVKLLLLD